MTYNKQKAAGLKLLKDGVLVPVVAEELEVPVFVVEEWQKGVEKDDSIDFDREQDPDKLSQMLQLKVIKGMKDLIEETVSIDRGDFESIKAVNKQAETLCKVYSALFAKADGLEGKDDEVSAHPLAHLLRE